MNVALCKCGCGQETPIARRSRPYLGHVLGEHTPFCHGHGNALRRRMEYAVEDRGFDTPCWIWLGTTRSNGYGKVSVRGRQVGAHAAMFELHRGPVPDGLELDHLCRVRNCVNPAHLEPVTRAENNRRARAAA